MIAFVGKKKKKSRIVLKNKNFVDSMATISTWFVCLVFKSLFRKYLTTKTEKTICYLANFKNNK